MQRRLLSPLFALISCGILGCGGEKLPETVRLSGIVRINGKPLDDARIIFYPADRQGAAPTIAPVQDGKFSAPMVPKGSYRVAFAPGEAPTEAEVPVTSETNAPAPKAKKNAIPEKFQKPTFPVEATADSSALSFDLNN